MKDYKFLRYLRNANSRSLLGAVGLALALTVTTPVMANGNKAHENPAPAASSEGVTSNASPASKLVAEEDPHGHSTFDTGKEHGEAVAEEAHDHAAHAPNEALLETGFGRFLVWLGKLHPAAVHFPIALLLAAAVAEILSMRYRPDFFQNAARFSLWFGALGALGAAALGWFYGGFRLVDEENLLTVHRWNGTGLTALALLTLWLNERRIRRDTAQKSLYRTALFVTALLVGLNGFLGGLMVYGPEQHQWPSPPAAHSD